MGARGRTAQAIRFGIFEVDLSTGELHKRGLKIKLRPQPFRMLAILLDHAGQVVTREQLREQLWTSETFVDFDHSLNTAINRIREALGDSAETPRYIETLARRGYRFIAPVEPHHSPSPSSERRGSGADFPPGSGGGQGVVVFADVGADGGAPAVAPVSDRRTAMRASPLPKIESIAVLPLENLSGDPGQEYFANGMTEALITDLGKISALRVISRTSVMRYKQTKKPLPAIARELRVDAVVEGSVLRSGGRVRITANLLHAPTDRHLWAESYERDLGEVLTLQGAVARAITMQVQAKVTTGEQSRLASRRAINPEAYQDYLMGVYHKWKTTADGHRLAIEYFQKAIGKDPQFALGYTGLTFVYLYDATRAASERGPAARAAAMKALELDPDLGEAHRALAEVKFKADWDWKAAEEEFKRAIELSPNDADGHHEYSHYLIAMGRPEESLRESKRAVEIDPLAAGMVMHMGWHYLQVREYDLAIKQYERALRLDGNLPEAHRQAGIAHELKGMLEEAVAHYLKAKMLNGTSPAEVEAFRRTFRTSGMKGYWKKQLEMDEKRRAKGAAVTPLTMSLSHEMVGNRGAALDWMEKGCHERPLDPSWLMLDPRLANLLLESRIKALLRRMNFPSMIGQ